jgi:hypothetical protein
MIIFFLSNLGMGGGGNAATVYIYVDPDAGTLIDTANDPGLAEVAPDEGSLIIV